MANERLQKEELKPPTVNQVFFSALKQQAGVCLWLFSLRSNLATPQAETKFENAEGNSNQAQRCQANAANHGLLGGGGDEGRPLGVAMRLLHQEAAAEEMKAARRRRLADRGHYSPSAIWLSHLPQPCRWFSPPSPLC